MCSMRVESSGSGEARRQRMTLQLARADELVRADLLARLRAELL